MDIGLAFYLQHLDGQKQSVNERQQYHHPRLQLCFKNAMMNRSVEQPLRSEYAARYQKRFTSWVMNDETFFTSTSSAYIVG